MNERNLIIRNTTGHGIDTEILTKMNDIEVNLTKILGVRSLNIGEIVPDQMIDVSLNCEVTEIQIENVLPDFQTRYKLHKIHNDNIRNQLGYRRRVV